jgi:hypothetical protein
MTHLYLPESCKCKHSIVLEYCAASYAVHQTASDLVLASHIFSTIQTVGSLNWPSPDSQGTGRSVQNQLLDHLYIGNCVKLQADSVPFGEEIRMQPLFLGAFQLAFLETWCDAMPHWPGMLCKNTA